MTTAVANSPADILNFQNQCVRTGDMEILGRMQKIAIGPNAQFVPRNDDPVIAKFGRFIELRDVPLPIAQTRDRSMLLVTAFLLTKEGRVELPDLPDPTWTPPAPTRAELEGVEVDREIKDADGKVIGRRKVREFAPLHESPRANVRLIPQRLEDRAEGRLAGTNFLVFSPVIRITFQPEINRRMAADAWVIECRYNPADRTHMALLVDQKTGETHFFGGAYEIVGNNAASYEKKVLHATDNARSPVPR
jgi:hypothetical protein